MLRSGIALALVVAACSGSSPRSIDATSASTAATASPDATSMSAAQPATPTEACQQKVRDDLVLRTLTELEPPEAVDSEQGTTVTGAIDTIHGKLRYHCGVRRVGEQWHVDLFLEAI